MKGENYSDAFVKAYEKAQSEANIKNHPFIDSSHFLLGVLESEAIQELLKGISVNVKNLHKETLGVVDKNPTVSNNDDLSVSSELTKSINRMHKIANKRSDESVTLYVAFIALFADKVAGAILKEHEVSKEEFETFFNKISNNQPIKEDYNEEQDRDFINKYTTNLTKLARDQKLDPIIGRDKEVRRTIKILQRRTKNNPVIVGESGVGKTAIIEGLAQRIINNEVPDSLRGKEIVSLDMGMLIAGAGVQGEFEKRLKGIIKEITNSEGRIMLFIDEMHLLMGAGKSGGGAMDAANLLKPELARGNMHVIGATTLDEYRQYVEKDSAMERRFQKVLAEEPSVEDTISILRGIKEKYEVHHGVKITDDAILAAAKLSDRYITDRNLPDKAIDLMDEAASVIRMEIESKPEKMDILNRKIIQKEIELSALSKDKTLKAKQRYNILKRAVNKMTREYSILEEKWFAEKASLVSEGDVREKIDNIKQEIEKGTREGKLDKVSELQYGTLPELEKQLIEAQQSDKKKVNRELLRHEVTENEIANVVSEWTGIPISKMNEKETEKLQSMESDISEQVIGQKKAIKSVSSCIRRSRAGLSDPSKPIGSFLFLGPTGVGKTELTKALSQQLFEDRENIVRVDMSEYMEKQSVSRLIGAAPGYVGYEEGGILTEAVRRKPYSIVLFDEIEKAHSDVFNVLLQVLDDGRLTDSQGRVVNFKNTVIIMTSNMGANIIQDGMEKNLSYEDIQEKVTKNLELYMRPEFINRIDDIVVFEPLTIEDVSKIAELRLIGLNKLLKSRELELRLDKKAMEKLVEKGYDRQFGARPLKRAIQRYIENPLSDQIIAGVFKKGTVIKCTVEGEDLVFKE
jgi:ATP-dependent Clp protease ATP-binding subunit ClpB